VRWAHIGAYPASFAVFQIYLDGDGFADYSFGTEKPALKTGGLILLGREAFPLVYHRTRAAPLACLSPFADARR
jgi:hypothetical protein